MTRTSDVFKSDYLQASDLRDRQVTLIISHYEIEQMGGRDQKKRDKPVLYFQKVRKGLVLNRTNTRTIEHSYGDEMDDWVGKPIVLYPRMVDFGGEEVLGIRVRVPSSAQATAPAHHQAAPGFTSGLPGDPAPAPRRPAATHLGQEDEPPAHTAPPAAGNYRHDMDDEIPF